MKSLTKKGNGNFMIDANKWKHKGLVQMCVETIRTPIRQLMHCMPSENRTVEEEEFYNALEIINKYINA